MSMKLQWYVMTLFNKNFKKIDIYFSKSLNFLNYLTTLNYQKNCIAVFLFKLCLNKKIEIYVV